MKSRPSAHTYSFLILFVITMESMYPLTPLPGGDALAQEGSIFERYEQRCQQLLAYADSTNERNYFVAAAKLFRKTDIETGIKMVEELLQDPTASGRGMFVIYELMAAYLYGFEEIPPQLKRKIWQSFRTRPLYRGDTENHWVMYYTGLYLAAQTWKGYDRDFWYTGKPSEENFREAEGWLNKWIEITTTIGQGEFDSPTYHMVFLSPMLVLAQFAEDPVMKKKAEMMVHYLLADFAVEHLQGMYCGAHSRDYPYDAIAPRKAPMTAWAWLYFGQTNPVMRTEVIAAALSSYQMPEIIYHIATDRSKPYVHTETKRVRNVIRFNQHRNPPVYKYTYMTKNFSLGSMHGGILQPIQQHAWDITFVSDKLNNTLFTLHPSVSERELGMFFPEEMKFVVDEVARFHSYYGKEDKWASSSPYEQTFQHQNTLIVLYNIPKGTKFEHIDGFFTKDLDERIYEPFTSDSNPSSRWIFCRAGNTYIAYYPLQPYEWIEEENCWRLRSNFLRNGCIVEVVAADDTPSFKEFQRKIKLNLINLDHLDRNFEVSYTNLTGDRMSFTYGGQRLLNGNAIDFKSYKLFNGPFLKAELGSGTLEMRYKEMKFFLDFNNP